MPELPITFKDDVKDEGRTIQMPELAIEYGKPEIATGGNLPIIFKDAPMDIDAKKTIELYPISQVTGVPLDTLYENHKEVKEGIQHKKNAGLIHQLRSKINIAEYDLQKSRMGWNDLIGIIDPDFDHKVAKLNERIQYESQFIDDDNFLLEEALLSVAGLYPVARESMREGFRGGLVTGMAVGGTAAIVAPPTVPVATAVGFTAGTSAFAAKEIAEIEAGNIYMNLYNLVDDQGNPIDPRLVKTFSMVGGVANGALEATGVRLLLKTIPGLDKVVSETVKKSIVKLLKDGSIKNYLLAQAGRYGKFLLGETAVEVGQEMNSMIMEETTKSVHELETGGQLKHLTADEIMDRLWETTEASILAFGLLGAPGHSIHTMSGLIEQRSKVKNEALKKLLPDNVVKDYTQEMNNTFYRVKNLFFGRRDTRVLENKNEGRKLNEELAGLTEGEQTPAELAVAMQLYRDNKNNPEAVEAALRGEKWEALVEPERVVSRGFEGILTKEQVIEQLETPVVDQKSLEIVGNAIARAMGVKELHTWEFLEEDPGYTGRYFYKQKKVSVFVGKEKTQKEIIDTISHELLHADPDFRYMPDGRETISGKELRDMSEEELKRVLPALRKARKHPKEFHERLKELRTKIPKKKEVKKLAKPLTETQLRLIEMSKTLTNAQKAFIDKIGKMYDEIGQEALGDEIIFNTMNNYVSRSWIKTKKTKDLISRLTQTTIHAKERRLPTIVEGWTEGLSMKTHSAVDNLIMYRDNIIRTVEQKRLINALARGKTDGGRPVFSTERLAEYERIKMPHYTPRKGVTHFAPRAVARQINNIFGVSAFDESQFMQNLTKFNALLKKIALSTSLFHNIAFMRSFYLGGKSMQWENMNFTTAHREGVEMIHNMDDIVKLGVYNGLTLNLIQDWEEELLVMGNDIDRITAKHTGSKRIQMMVADLWKRQVEFTFGVQGAGLKIKAFAYELRSERMKHPDENINKTAARVATLMNDDFGGLHLERLADVHPTYQHIFRLVALAPDWTRSNIRTVTGMFRRASKGGYAAQRQLYRRFWARIVLKSMAATAMGNMLLAGGDIDEAWDRYKAGVEKDWKNIASIDITPLWGLFGMKPQDRKYFSVMGHFLDPVKFAGIPLGEPKILQYKSSILMRLISDWLYNENWRGKRFKNLGEIPLDVKEFAEYLDPDTYVTYRPEKRKGTLLEKNFSFPAFLIHSAIGSSPIAFQNLMATISGEQDWLTGLSNTLGIRQPRGRRKRRRYR